MDSTWESLTEQNTTRNTHLIEPKYELKHSRRHSTEGRRTIDHTFSRYTGMRAHPHTSKQTHTHTDTDFLPRGGNTTVPNEHKNGTEQRTWAQVLRQPIASSVAQRLSTHKSSLSALFSCVMACIYKKESLALNINNQLDFDSWELNLR